MVGGAVGKTGSIEAPAPRGARVASLILAVAIVIGAQALWLLVPAATLWVVGQLFDTTEGIFFTAMVAIPTALVAFTCLLVTANRRYLRLTGRDGGRGPLDAVLPPTIVLAILGGLVWFIFFANHMPNGQEQLIP